MRLSRLAAATLIVVMTSLAFVSDAVAAESAASYDPDDVAHRLDLRSVVLQEMPSGLTRITVTFWNRVPTWAVHRDVLWITTGGYDFRIFRNGHGRLRIGGGDFGSVVTTRPARHPDGYTYVGRHYVFGAQPPPDDLRALTFRRKLDCPRSCHWWDHGTRIDRTPRVPL
jgi:hypothetical protein